MFYDDLSVWEHLEYIARLHETEGWEQQAVDLVEMVGLTPRVDDLPTTFSRGLKQKAAIAMAFVRPFDVMLVDEPFVGLDRTGRDALLELFTLAHADGATLVVATHELSTVKTSDRLLALNGGHLSYDGSARRRRRRDADRGHPGRRGLSRHRSPARDRTRPPGARHRGIAEIGAAGCSDRRVVV